MRGVHPDDASQHVASISVAIDKVVFEEKRVPGFELVDCRFDGEFEFSLNDETEGFALVGDLIDLLSSGLDAVDIAFQQVAGRKGDESLVRDACPAADRVGR